MMFQPSMDAIRYLSGMRGIEIGAAAYNPFGLDTINVSNEAPGGFYWNAQIELCGSAANIDVIADGSKLPFQNSSVDFVLSSHVLEHFPDPIGAIEEWLRVIRPGGYIFAIVPHKDRTFDINRPRTTLDELQYRHTEKDKWLASLSEGEKDQHYSVWITQDVVDMLHYMGLNVVYVRDVDDKVGNGFTVVVQR